MTLLGKSTTVTIESSCVSQPSMIADVALPRRRFQVFTYQVPAHLLSDLQVGSAVVVPLGSAILSGIVVALYGPQHSTLLQSRFGHKRLRPIISLEADTPHHALEQNLIRLAERISDYYLAPLPACFRLILPPHSVKVARRVFITKEGHLALSDKSLPSDIQLVLRKLQRSSRGVLRSSLTRAGRNFPAALTYGKKKGWITERTTASTADSRGQMSSSDINRNTPHSDSAGLFDLHTETHKDPLERKTLCSAEKSLIGERISYAAQAGNFQEIPVVGTESFRQNQLSIVVETICRQGRRALILVPEVHQAETLGGRLQSDLKFPVTVYHGQLSSIIRCARWKQIRQGEIQAVVGTRSALFLPIPDLGLIWIDQEEDSSYKDEHLPYYHAREVARMRGECEQTLVIYASACPSLEVFGRFRDQINEVLERSGQEAARVKMIDLRLLPYETIVSPDLQTSMTRVLEDGEQVILLLNRKGFSGTLICRDCGMTPTCSACGVPMKLYQRPSRLVCFYCEGIRQTPERCPTCQGTVFRFPGTGTQRLEEEVLRLFPSFSVARFDRENVKSAAAADEWLRQFQQKKIHILIGTELLIHHSDPPTANLIGISHADFGLHIPDFRSAERTFQMLSKALVLARHGKTSAEVILQTNLPDHHVLTAIGQHRPRMFYDQELELRELLGYPPATHVILLVVAGAQLSRVQRVVEFLHQRLGRLEIKVAPYDIKKGILETPRILGPIVSRKPGRSQKKRMLFLIKTHLLQETQQCLRDIQREYETEFLKGPVVLEIHVDPIAIE